MNCLSSCLPLAFTSWSQTVVVPIYYWILPLLSLYLFSDWVSGSLRTSSVILCNISSASFSKTMPSVTVRLLSYLVSCYLFHSDFLTVFSSEALNNFRDYITLPTSFLTGALLTKLNGCHAVFLGIFHLNLQFIFALHLEYLHDCSSFNSQVLSHSLWKPSIMV